MNSDFCFVDSWRSILCNFNMNQNLIYAMTSQYQPTILFVRAIFVELQENVRLLNSKSVSFTLELANC